MEYCCQNMDAYATEKNSLLTYNPINRTYLFYLHNNARGTHQEMWYCPWCGIKVPDDLGEVWGEVLKEEFHIEDPFREWDRVPSEFKTDEWWKKRGL